MENDLIRRGDVLKLIEDIKCNRDVPKNYGTLLDIMQMIRSLPTAYDVDKVVEQLEDMSGIQFDGNNESYQLDWCIELNRVIEIVRNGGRM